MVRVLQRPEAGNRFVYVADYRTTQNEILAGLEKAAGGEKYQITKVNSAEEYKESLPKVLQGDYSVAMNLLRSVIYSGDSIYDYDKNHGLDNDKLDLPKPEPLEEFLAEIIKE